MTTSRAHDREAGGYPRDDMEIEIHQWTSIPRSTLTRYPLEVVDLIHTACIAAMQHERDLVLPKVRAACALIELGDQRLMATDGPINDQPPRLDLKEWRTMYKQLDRARTLLENPI